MTSTKIISILTKTIRRNFALSLHVDLSQMLAVKVGIAYHS